jgi:dipeptide/tripeptide permease
MIINTVTMVTKAYEMLNSITKPTAFLIASLALHGCMEVTNSGVGNSSSGDPLSGSMTYNAAGTAGRFVLTNISGQTCEGNVEFTAADVANFPITCNDGVTGNAISTINRFSSQQTISYRLSNGETGSVTLGKI